MTQKMDILQYDALVRAIMRREKIDEENRLWAEEYLDEALRKLKATKSKITKAAIFRLVDRDHKEQMATWRAEMAYAAGC